MAISQPRVTLLEFDGRTTLNEKASALFEPHPAATKVVLVAVFDQSGTLDVDWIDLAGNAHEIVSATATTANTPEFVTFDYNPGTIRARFTPSAQPVTGTIEASYSGHAGGLA